ncbi:hypothetical protein [Lacrimispora sp.]
MENGIKKELQAEIVLEAFFDMGYNNKKACLHCSKAGISARYP